MISEMINALRAGQELKNSTKWKNLQATTGLVTALLGAGIMVLGWVGIHPPLSAEQVGALAGGIAAVLGLFNGYTTVATTQRDDVMGLPPKRPDNDDGASGIQAAPPGD